MLNSTHNLNAVFLGMKFKTLLATTIFASSVGSALAGGFDRGGVNIDLLFSEKQYALESSVTRVYPQRRLKNIQRSDTLPAGVKNLHTGSTSIDSSYTIPRVGVKFGLFEDLDCLATYTRPTGADIDYGTNNAHSPSAVRFHLKTDDYGLTCGYKFSAGTTSLGEAQLRVIGGFSYLELTGYQTRQSYLAVAGLPPAFWPVPKPSGLGRLELKDENWGWRAGAAYEIPDIKLRAQLVYQSKYDLDDLRGTLDLTGYGVPLAFGGRTHISAKSEIPQSLEFKLQSGIAEDTLAFASIKWQDWSKLQSIAIKSSRVANLALDAYYRDGWTITGGIGKKLSEELSAQMSLTWDRGTATVVGTQSSSWLLSTGVSRKLNENSELVFGGGIGFMEGGISRPHGKSVGSKVSYEYDADVLYALTARLKFTF